MNDEDFRNLTTNSLYGVYGVTPTYDEKRWINFLNRGRRLTHSIRDLNKCGIVVNYNNRNKIVHNYE